MDAPLATGMTYVGRVYVLTVPLINALFAIGTIATHIFNVVSIQYSIPFDGLMQEFI